MLGLAALLYQRADYSWLLFAALFLAPDLSIAGYLAGPRAGAAGYNVAHSYLAPMLAAAVAMMTGASPAIALIWGAHIGFDRALGYGLKYPMGFTATHLGRLQRTPSSARQRRG